MVEPTGTYVPANIARLGHHNRQARPPRQGSSFDRARNSLRYEENMARRQIDMSKCHIGTLQVSGLYL
ncbi:unnamed protein product [Schistosoma margrebowiei]|uniref:Uncharacterized protein n=1 Tax=Schistosoma margrebowiei TaxID=48269 RepID=A0A183LLZ4_9TREM|nr:unnamed protein product [Schistosoma margrebowiei]